ncbi:MAG: hypothetical protein GXP23_11565 [Gammaproteobacteria bacterium]|nr:hypothetical protein [Gammaproteobacteria bacterium]
MTASVKLSVIVAVQYAEGNLTDIVASLDPGQHPEVEFIFCYTQADPQTSDYLPVLENIVALEAPVGSLIPHLWAHGIRSATGEAVAVTTAHVIPETDWLDILMQTTLTDYPGVGGVIVNDPGASYRDWAIYLLRYIAFSPPAVESVVDEIAADNALYCRKTLLEHHDLLDTGFWEPSFHARFRKQGQHLLLNPELIVVHRNQYSCSQFFFQRYAHGRAFGLARAIQLSKMKRRILIVLSLILPAVFLGKIVSSVFKQGLYTSYLFGSFPWLLWFLFGWGLGEARGYLDSLHNDMEKSS